MIPSVLSSQLIKGTKDFLTTTFPSSTPAFFEMMKEFVEKDANLFKGPFISVALPFKKGTVDKNYFPDILEDSFKPYYHQELAFKRLGGTFAKPTLIATGTGSGKTEAFMYPILEYCYKNRDTKGIKAIIIYPMNALATDQAKRFAKSISQAYALKGIRVGLYIGSQEDNPRKMMSPDYVITDKDTLRDNPPDILLTNYKMLDFMLMRPRDQKVWRFNLDNDILKYIAVDEIHTFDGASGTDLASLIRRLRAKVDVKKGTLACIGTSATLGGDTASDIREFASDIFGEEFDEDSVISEYRITPEEFFDGSEDEILFFPQPSQLKDLDFNNYSNVDEYIKAQYQLWFNKDVEDVTSDEFKVKLGVELKELYFFRLLLKTLDAKIKSRDSIIEAFIRKIPIKSSDNYFEYMIDSLLALTSWAKDKKQGKNYPPFLFVRVQIWLRELARMVAGIGEKPTLIYSDDLKSQEMQKYYPVIHCRDCHATGWGGVKKDGNSELQSELKLFYQAFFSHDSRVKFIFPIDDSFQNLPGKIYYVDKNGMEIIDKDDEANGIKVYEPNNIDTKGKSHSHCPFCNSKNSLTILGARAASLTSVLIGQNFTSYYNDDKKLIAFSDSVQDAAHRAGFFGARSYQFTIRSALQQALEAHGGEVYLNEIRDVVSNYWLNKLGDEKQYAAMLIAPDMEWLREYDNLVKTGDLNNPKELIELINSRIEWMIHSEYGFKSHIGRTLERSNASVMYVDNISKVVEAILPLVKNELESLRDISKEELEKFIFGLLIYMKNIGAIFSFHVEPYITSAGETYQINQLYPRNRYMAKFSPNSRNPKFLTNGKFKAFEKISNKTDSSWFDRWKKHNFTDRYVLLPDTLSLMRIVLNKLVKEKVVLEKDVKDSVVWGLNPEKLSISSDTKQVRCSHCKHILTIHSTQLKIVTDMSCLRKECIGKYQLHDSVDSYYKLLYSKGTLQRVVAKEHTGLLQRVDREKVENDFIKRKPNQPWKTNLLSATPTLEMGIDIGDLSSVILCSVPPNGTNYLQRIGRAGRTDGNAFTATVANATNHDLYFYEEPDEIMQGSIEAPGIYLDASAILQRQFLAYCIDTWVSKNSISSKELPHKLNSVINNINKNQKDKFPYTLFAFIEDNQAGLLQGFFDLYEEKLQENSKKRVQQFVSGTDKSDGLIYKVLNRLELIGQEQKSLSSQINSLRKRLKEHLSQEAKDKDHEEKTREINTELDGLKSILLLLKRKQTFEFFADEGLLPNYAFPESGVILKSVIYRKKDTKADESGRKYDTYTYEYERAGSSAISELAPNNSFYAGGRKVKIDQIDMNISEVESWVFCDKCSFSQRATNEQINSCPKCDSEMFGDNGQKKEILRMKQVLATADDKSSRLRDDKDQRDILFFNKQLLINFDKKHIEDAYAVMSDDSSFGFEFIKKVNFKEINFGEVTLIGNDISIAGKSVPRKGFVICKSCGKVQFGKPTDEKFKPDHSFSCELEDKSDPKNYFESLYLYREFNSEAIRLMLPISSLDIDDEKLHSLIATFQLGLKEYFRGSVEHLRVGVYDEVESSDEHTKRYLILYDTVPGGTGYLKQLMRDQKPLFEVLEVALKKLKSCKCSSNHEKDGCYKCIYAYKNNFDRPLISKRKAIEVIENILKSKENIQKVESVSDVKSDNLSESVLEELFLSKLKSVSSVWKKEITTRGRSGYLFEIVDANDKKYSYEIEQQVEIDSEKYSRADFVIYPLKNSEMKPIVVFTDGFAYHQDRVAEDSAQRMSIAKSGDFIVWSLTWEDIEEYDKRKPNYKYINYLNENYLNIKLFKKLYHENKSFLNMSSFEWLLELLRSRDVLNWSQKAKTISASFIKEPFDVEDIILQKTLTLEMQDNILNPTQNYFYGKYTNEDISLISIAKHEQLSKNDFVDNIFILYLEDRLGKLDFKSWAGLLRMYNIMQFLENSFFTTTIGVSRDFYVDINFNKKMDTTTEWNLVFEEVLDEAKELVKELSKNGKIPIPTVGEELANGYEAELMWSKFKIAITVEKEVKLEGWNIFNIEEKEKIIQILKQRINL